MKLMERETGIEPETSTLAEGAPVRDVKGRLGIRELAALAAALHSPCELTYFDFEASFRSSRDVHPAMQTSARSADEKLSPFKRLTIPPDRRSGQGQDETREISGHPAARQRPPNRGSRLNEDPRRASGS